MTLKQTKMYKMIFLSYTIIMTLSVIILQAYFYNYTTNNTKQSHLDANNKSVQQIINYINEIEDNATIITNLLYESQQELNDIRNFLVKDTQTYLADKLNDFYESKNSQLDMRGFIKKSFRMNSHITNISLMSYEKNNVITFNRDGDISTQIMSYRPQGYKEVQIIGNTNTITIIKKIRDSGIQKELGALAISYQLSDLVNYTKMYKQIIENHNFILLDQRGMVIYDTKEQYNYIQYPYLENNMIKKENLEGLTNSYMNIAYHNIGITVIGCIPKEAIKFNFGSLLTIFLIGLIIFISGEIFAYIKLTSLAQRTGEILEAMEKVKGGDLNIRIKITNKDDEIKMIADNFNDMCVKLDTYIQKSYLAELEQQRVEMDMLQTQINPHFLYNTLEVIRVKAICNNDRQVGKMLYGLAVIFRSQIKENNIISLGKELHYCKKYIELLRLRYEDCFTFEFIYDEKVLENTILKFIIQPIIENYFVHGIRIDDTDNHIKLKIKEKDVVIIVIEDNGKGIEEKKLLEIQNNLDTGIYNGNSLGIFNVQKRLVMSYGKDYKLKIENVSTGGTRTYIKIPIRRG